MERERDEFLSSSNGSFARSKNDAKLIFLKLSRICLKLRLLV